MTQSLILIGLFMAVLACIPFAVRRLQQRGLKGVLAPAGAERSRLLSAIPVGPQQSVVTIEAGPDGARVCLVLGVTPQHISCLHVTPLPVDASRAPAAPVVQQPDFRL